MSGVPIDLEQRSEAWFAFRKGKLGASDAAAVINKSPYKTQLQLWEEMCLLRPVEDISHAFHVLRGIRLEPLVRAKCEFLLNAEFPSRVFAHKEHEWLIASLDGWDASQNKALEIKVGGKNDHERTKMVHLPPIERVPEKYYPQLQHQMLVSGAEGAFYASFYVTPKEPEVNGDLSVVYVPRDEDFIRSYFGRAQVFYRCVRDKIRPDGEWVNEAMAISCSILEVEGALSNLRGILDTHVAKLEDLFTKSASKEVAEAH